MIDIEENKENSKNTDLMKNLKIIKEINQLIKDNKKKLKEEIENKIILYLKEKNISNPNEIKDGERSNLPQIFLNQNEDFSLNIILSVFSKILTLQQLNETFLNEDISGKNILEISSDYGEYNLFIVLTKYIENNSSLLNNLIKPNRTNVFHLAADSNHVISILYFFNLYKNKIKYLNEKNLVGSTPLHLACYRGNYECVNALVDLGCDLNIKDNEGRTPIFYSGNREIAVKLILNGAFKFIKDNKGRTPYQYINDDNIKNVLKQKTFFEIYFQCKINYESLKNQRKDIVLFIYLISIIFIQLLCKIRYLNSNFSFNCLGNESFTYENIFNYLDIIFESITLIISILFHIKKEKDNKINKNEVELNSKFNTNDNDSITTSLYPKSECSTKINDSENHKSLFEKYHNNCFICLRCEKDMKQNTQHCCACDKCIDDWDHHCFWLNICINKNNKKYFYIFLVFIVFTFLFNAISSVLYLIDIFEYKYIYLGIFTNNDNCIGNLFISILITVVLIFYCLLMFIILFSMIIPFLLS
jgi:palmitoyltransferase